ncbi:MAG: transaldolase family protein, partial [Aquaticitalea sp.]
VMVDPLLKEKGSDTLVGKVAIASAKKAYQIYLEMIASDRFKKLEAKGAQRQRVLWASTSTKDPAFSDVLYVETLIGKDTINTLPMETIDAFRDHGNAAETLTNGIDHANKVMADLKDKGVDIDNITQKLEDEGIDKFSKAYEKLIKSIDDQKRKKS